ERCGRLRKPLLTPTTPMAAMARVAALRTWGNVAALARVLAASRIGCSSKPIKCFKTAFSGQTTRCVVLRGLRLECCATEYAGQKPAVYGLLLSHWSDDKCDVTSLCSGAKCYKRCTTKRLS